MGKQKRSRAQLPMAGFGSVQTAPAVIREPTELQLAIDAFDRAFTDAYGARPTWGAKQCAQLKRLLSAHGLDEVLRRMGLLFGGALSWPPAPYDLGVLVLQFDRLVAPTSGRGVRPSDVLGRIKP